MNISRFTLGLEPSHEQYSTDDEVMLCQQIPDGCYMTHEGLHLTVNTPGCSIFKTSNPYACFGV